MVDHIEPEIVAARALQSAMVPPFDVMRLPPAEGRALANRAAMLFNDGLPALQRVEGLAIEGPGGPIRARLYQSAAATSSDAAILYIHGGGWFACDVDTHDRMLRFLAEASDLTVLAFDYRLSPEHPFPAALDDCRAVWRWMHVEGGAHGIPNAKIMVAGDSAGANLALALTLAERDAQGRMPAGLALLYGCFAPEQHNESRARYGSGAYGLTGERLDWYWANYLGTATADPPALAMPLLAPLHGLPPTYIGIAEYDVVADESRLLAQRLADANVPVELETWLRATHGMLQMTRDVECARIAVRSIAAALCGFAGR